MWLALAENLISHFCKLKGSNSDLYQKIISLPFVTSIEKFDKIVKETKDSAHVSAKQLQYMELKLETKSL